MSATRFARRDWEIMAETIAQALASGERADGQGLTDDNLVAMFLAAGGNPLDLSSEGRNGGAYTVASVALDTLPASVVAGDADGPELPAPKGPCGLPGWTIGDVLRRKIASGRGRN